MTETKDQERMVAKTHPIDPHKNTAHSKRVNDRARRRNKRVERRELKDSIKSGAFAALARKR